MQRRHFLLLSSSSLLTGCMGGALTNKNIDPSLLADAQARANDGVLREEDVRGGFANGTVGDQLSKLTPRQIARVGSGSLADYLSGGQALPATLPQVARQDLSRFYAARNNAPAWIQNGVWTPKAQQLFNAFVQAPVDGLLPRAYLPGEHAMAQDVPPGSAAAAQIDLELTAGLIRYIKDAREGRFSGRHSLDAVPLAQGVYASASLERGLEGQVNQGQVYQMIRNPGKQHVRFLNGAEFDAYRVTLESLRAQPIDLSAQGKYLISNIAAQEVFAMRDGRRELAMNMVVGRPTRQTPVQDDTIVSVKFSPDWTAPKSIVRADLIPKAPQIFTDMGIEVRQNGQAVDPMTIAWNEAAASQYDFVQPPGPLNVLGGVRFTLQNSSAIYMHDSPDRVLFNKVNRIYSSGCMRLEKSAELAHWLLKDQDASWTMRRVQEAMTQSTFSTVRLIERVPVKTVYLEAWPSHKGGLRVMPDIYGLNAKLRERMGIAARRAGDPADLSAFKTSIF